MRRWLIVVLLLLAPGSAAARAGALQAGTGRSDTGSYPLRWDSGGAEVVLEEATRGDFSDARVIYRGRDERTVISGRLDGRYFYRLRTEGGTWQAPVEVVVAHHDLGKAVLFLAVGAIVFLSTATLIVVGHIRHRREGPEEEGGPA